jgi:hypothetical protein
MSILQGLCGTKTGLYAAWKGETDDDRMFLAAFANNSWTGLGTIPGNSSIGPSLAMVGDKLYAAWKGEHDDERLFYAAFDGKNWDSQATIPGNSSVGPALATMGGRLYAAWKGESPLDQRLFFSSLQNGAWVPQQQIPKVASSIGPSLAGLGTKLYAAWKGMDSDQGLYYAVFDGMSWSDQSSIPGVASSVGPSLAVIGTTLYAAWKGEGNDQRLWYASFDGNKWSGQKQIPGTASSLGPALAAFGADLYAMWKGAGTDQSLWYAAFTNSEWSGQQTLPGNTGQDTIRFVWIPDIHLEMTGQPATWIAQAKWINSNQFGYNIQGIFCAGDVYISPTGQDYEPKEMPPAWNEGFSLIDAMGKPYLTCAGNHDYDGGIYNTTSFDQNIGYQRIFQKPWYVSYWAAPPVAGMGDPGTPPLPPGGYPSMATQAIRFDVGARQFLVIALEFFPRQGALDWAASIINQFPASDVIILDHGYMTMLGNLFTVNGDDNNNFAPSPTYNPGFTTGVQVNAWARTFPNVRLVLCGHDIPSDGQQSGIANVSHRIDPSAGGHNILGVYADYQFTIAPDQLTSQVILLLEMGEQQLTVRGFNTTTNAERSTPYPFSLPWS